MLTFFLLLSGVPLPTYLPEEETAVMEGARHSHTKPERPTLWDCLLESRQWLQMSVSTSWRKQQFMELEPLCSLSPLYFLSLS